MMTRYVKMTTIGLKELTLCAYNAAYESYSSYAMMKDGKRIGTLRVYGPVALADRGIRTMAYSCGSGVTFTIYLKNEEPLTGVYFENEA